MRISLLRILLLRFFKTFHIYLANAILYIFCECNFMANVILCAIYFVTAIIS